MTKPIVEAPERWTEDNSASVEGRLGELFRSVEKPVPLSPAALAQVHARLGSARRSSSLRRRVREAVLAGSMLLAGSSLAVAGWGVNEWWTSRAAHRERALLSGTSSTDALQASKHGAPQVARPASPAAADEDTDSPDIAVPLAPRGFGARNANRSSNTAPADSSELASESLALQAVLVKLRREHDAKGALMLLDQSQPLFARGTLALEAQVARVDALLALNRQSEALAILNHLPLAHIGRGGELRLLRAELRAKDDCGLALADFDMLVRRPLSPALAERALYGRAACEERIGDGAGAQRDFHEYLDRFPQGRFAERARGQLSAAIGKAP